MNKTRVLIVDDSALMRKLLRELLSADPHIEVVDAVGDAMAARERIKALDPDVLTLDVEMPGMDGLSFLEKLMRLRPMPVVMISAMTQRGADTTMKALMLGAVDFIGKPQLRTHDSLDEFGDVICQKVKSAAEASMHPRAADAPAAKVTSPVGSDQDTIIAIGASTGGVEAIYKLLVQLPADVPPIVIAQHIPPLFSASFARRLNEQVSLDVAEAADGDRLARGKVYIAPGDRHLTVSGTRGAGRCRLTSGPRVNRHIPSVDVLFKSLTRRREQIIAILLTGMGDDGVEGMAMLQHEGAETIAQDQSSSVVWGMPGAAVARGAANRVVPLERMGERLDALLAAATTT